jgi:anti-sigma factor RsiW
MDWTCTYTEERLIDYLDGGLLPDEAAAFSAHAAGCAGCTQLVARVGGLITQMHQIPPVEEPAELVGAILAATLGPRTRERGLRTLAGMAADDLAAAIRGGSRDSGGVVRHRVACGGRKTQ